MRLTKPVPSLYREDGSIKEVTTAAYTPKNFRRIFPNQIFPVMSLFANKPTKIIIYLLANADSNNMVYCTYKGIQRDCKITDRKTIAKTLLELKKCETIVELSTSRYMINPAVMLKGNDQKYGLLASWFNGLLSERRSREIQRQGTQNNNKTQED